MEKATTYDCKFAEGMDVAADCKAEEQTKNQGDSYDNKITNQKFSLPNYLSTDISFFLLLVGNQGGSNPVN